jgi:hypothetical protein
LIKDAKKCEACLHYGKTPLKGKGSRSGPCWSGCGPERIHFEYAKEEDQYLDELPEKDMEILLSWQLHHMTETDRLEAVSLDGKQKYVFLLRKAKEFKRQGKEPKIKVKKDTIEDYELD